MYEGIAVAKLKNLIVSTLKNSDDELTLAEIAERLGEFKKKVFKALRKLFQKDIVSSENRRYRLSNR